jgi:Arc/MetJ-type ribon-helix-helix transcriptional regulator
MPDLFIMVTHLAPEPNRVGGTCRAYDDRMKERLTISVDPTLAEAAADAVAAGRAESVSAWVTEAMRDRMAKDHRLEALADAISGYEAEHGEITDEEMAEQVRADRDAAGRERSGRRGGGRGAA